MMNCNEFEYNLDAYMEGTADRALSKLLDAHRRDCRQCARLYRLHKVVLTSLDSTETVMAPAGLSERILAAVETYESEAAVAKAAGPFRKFGVIAAATAAFGSVAATLALMVRIVIGYRPELLAGISRIATFTFSLDGIKAVAAGNVASVTSYFESLRMPDQWQTWLGYIVEPVQLPYLQAAFPAWYFALAAGFVVISWLILDYYYTSPADQPYFG